MRVTAEAKAETRLRILGAATRLFAKDGWDGTTTRAIATAAGIATGTLFNYFQSKESIAAELIAEALERARTTVGRRRGQPGSLEEELFALIWAELRSLAGYRGFLPAAAETVLSPLRRPTVESPAETIRTDHLEAVQEILARHGVPVPLPLVTLQLYWALYLGVFGFWSTDESPHQEDSLALLDRTLKLFIGALNGGGGGLRPEDQNGREASHERETE